MSYQKITTVLKDGVLVRAETHEMNSDEIAAVVYGQEYFVVPND